MVVAGPSIVYYKRNIWVSMSWYLIQNVVLQAWATLAQVQKKKKYNSIYSGATDLSLSVADLQGVGLGLVNRWVEPLH